MHRQALLLEVQISAFSIRLNEILFALHSEVNGLRVKICESGKNEQVNRLAGVDSNSNSTRTSMWAAWDVQGAVLRKDWTFSFAHCSASTG